MTARFMKRYNRASIAVLLLLMMLVSSIAVTPAIAADPPAPWQTQWLYGTVTINGAAAPAATAVSAYVNGALNASTTVDSSGKYGWTPEFYITGSDGQSVTFKVGTTDAPQSTVFTGGTPTRVNLAISTTSLSVSTGAATSIGSSIATLNGTLSNMGGLSPVNVYFNYGTVPTYGSTTSAQSRTSTGAFTADLTSLTPGTTYYFQAVANSGSTTVYGSQLTLTTTASALTVTTTAATGITSSTAILNGNLTDRGPDSSVQAYFEYGTTPSLGTATAAQTKTATGTFNHSLSGLLSNTRYYFRSVAVGTTTVYGATLDFTTSVGSFSVTTGSATLVSANTATLNGTLTGLGSNPSATVYFNYGTTTSYGSTTPNQTQTLAGGFIAPISGLSPNTTYNFQAVATAGSSTVTGANATFTTSANSGSMGPPHQFYGIVYVGGARATSGTNVAAYVNGSLAASTTTDSSGRYGYASLFYVPGTSGSVTFYVNSVLTSQTATFMSGSVTRLDLYSSQATLAVTTNSATYAGTSSATLSGSITGWSTSDTSATTSFVWGTTSGGPYSNTVTASPSSFTGTGSFTGTLSGLTSGQTYYIKAKAVGTSSGEKLGDQLTYVHTPGGTLSVTTGSGSYASSTTATLSSTLAGLGSDSSATCYIDYGLTTSYGSSTSGTTLTSTGGYSATASSLVAGQTYHIRGRVVGSPSGTTAYGSDVTYVHSSGGTLAVSTTGGTYATTTTATFAGSLTGLGTDTAATVSFEYGTSTAYGSTTSTSSVSSIGAYSISATGLTSGTTYHMRAKAVGSPSGSTVYGSDVTYVHSPGTCGSDPVGCTVGAFCTTVMPFWVYASRYTATGSATIDQINVRSYGTGNMKVAIYSDSFNSVGTLIAGSTGEGAVTAGLNSIPLDSPVTITAGTTYWLAEWSDARIFSFTLEPGVYANSNSAYASFDFSTATISWIYPTPGTHRGLISGSN